MYTSDFYYDLPEKFIAQTPVEPRDSSRLLVFHRAQQSIDNIRFNRLPEFLMPGDVLVLNQTRVVRARLIGIKKPGGGKAEILLLNPRDELHWEVLVGGKGLKAGKEIDFGKGIGLQIIQDLHGSQRLVRFNRPVENYLSDLGQVPLPPYIRQKLHDPERYQTVYSTQNGSAAAPTAGLHFSSSLLDTLKCKGIEIAFITLHVGLDTFSPVTEEHPEDHQIHSEWCEISKTTADQINTARSRGNRVIAVGTTSVRVLESVSFTDQLQRWTKPFSGSTRLYILPGYKFQSLDGMITNFHLPRSTLIMLVSAFAGWQNVHNLYELAKKLDYRFYSFGDAMLIL